MLNSININRLDIVVQINSSHFRKNNRHKYRNTYKSLAAKHPVNSELAKDICKVTGALSFSTLCLVILADISGCCAAFAGNSPPFADSEHLDNRR